MFSKIFTILVFIALGYKPAWGFDIVKEEDFVFSDHYLVDVDVPVVNESRVYNLNVKYGGTWIGLLTGPKPYDDVEVDNAVCKWIRDNSVRDDLLRHMAKYSPLPVSRRTAKVCVTRVIEARFKEWGYVSDPVKDEYCAIADYPILPCTAKKVAQHSTMFDLFTVVMDDLDHIEADEHVQMAWMDICWHISPILFSLVPIVLRGWEKLTLTGAVLLTVLYYLIFPFFEMDDSVYYFNLAMCIASMTFSPRDEEMARITSSVVGMVCIMCISLYRNHTVQVLVITAASLMYVGLFLDTFFRRRNGTQSGMLILLLEVSVMQGQIRFMRSYMSKASLVYDAIEILTNTILPSGKKWSFLLNARTLSYTLVEFVGPADDRDESKMILGLVLLQFMMFIGVRAAIGTLYVRNMRYNFQFGNLWDAFIVYCTGFHRPFYGILSHLSGQGRSFNQMLYSTLSATLFLFECRYAVEFLFIRFVAVVYDVTWCNGFYNRQHANLSVNMEFPGREFKKEGSMPPIDIQKLNEIMKATVTLLTRTADGLKRGAGFILKGDDAEQRLFTVSHVVPEDGFRVSKRKGQAALEFQGRKFHGLRAATDPVVHTVIKDFPDPADVPIVEMGDLHQVKALLTVIPDHKTGSCRVRFIPQFEYDKTRHCFLVRSTYVEGDSGSPTFAAFDDGTLAYCGAVQSGTLNRYSGNIVTAYTKVGEPLHEDLSSTDSDDDAVSMDCQPKKHMLAQATHSLVDAINDLRKKTVIRVDERTDKGWYEVKPEDWDDPECEPETDDEEDVKKRKRNKRNRRYKAYVKEYNAWRGVVDAKLHNIRNLATILHGAKRADALIRYIEFVKGDLEIPPFNMISIDEMGRPVIAEQPESLHWKVKQP